MLESILAFCTASGHVRAVAAVAQTCQQLRSLIYDSLDHYLWRTLFLTTFDDPRTMGQHEYDWNIQLTERVWSRGFIQSNAQALVYTGGHYLRSTLTRSSMFRLDQLPAVGNSDANLRALTSLLFVIRTAAPAAPRPESPRLKDSTIRQLHTVNPMYPPLPLHQEALSLNISWLTDTLSSGLPFMMTRILTLEHIAFDWRHLSDGKSLGQLTTYLGFLPSKLVSVDCGQSAQATGGPVSPFEMRFDPRQTLDMNEATQWDRAREFMLPHVFNMSYLSARRNWGPYMLASRQQSTGVDIVDEEVSIDWDADYEPSGDDASSSLSATSASSPTHIATKLLSQELLYPDWTWLAAARVIAQLKLRANVDAEAVERLVAWDNLRAGAWGDSVSRPIQTVSTDAAGSSTFERDWAGVQGTWRRLVCWLDYDDLHNANYWTNFSDPTLDEAWIIVPLSLRITGYSAPAVSAYPDRPTIIIEGEMGGGGWDENIVSPHHDDVRRVHGTVSMLPDGTVRHSITSTGPGSTEDEWSSEAVQLGGVGSAMGSLGVWTGATHQPDDPLGVIWQWRVG